MSKIVWRDDIANAPHGRLLLLITKPQMLDAATEHIYDILVDTGTRNQRHSLQPPVRPQRELAKAKKYTGFQVGRVAGSFGRNLAVAGPPFRCSALNMSSRVWKYS